jgi:hypothetical protein
MKKLLLVCAASLLAAQVALADQKLPKTVEVTVTNITSGQSFTPLLVVSHTKNIALFELGQPALEQLAVVAEGGDIGPLDMLLNSLNGKVGATAATSGLLGPGQSVTIEVRAGGRFDRISLAGMLIPTNDTFVALDGVRASRWEKTYHVPAYDAGSEYNDELCANIPGPVCGGEGYSDAGGEGYVHISRGITGFGDLEAASYDWRNPVAEIKVREKR